MRIWLDAHLSPQLARWIASSFQIEAVSTIDAGMHTMKDEQLFQRARTENAVLMTKDSDFVDLVSRHGPPPQIIHLTLGNTSNAELQRVLAAALPEALKMLASGERLVEIGGMD